VRYKEEVDHYLKEKQYTNIKALVAFSGTVKDPDTGAEYTEPQMNKFGERELPERFEPDEYRLLLVADKYQTGFDQPLLHTNKVIDRMEQNQEIADKLMSEDRFAEVVSDFLLQKVYGRLRGE
jgi:type I restriction enzyme, R subunit